MRKQDPRMLFGFGVLLVIAGLAAMIALGKVHQESSFGLQILLGSLTTLAGAFANWAYGREIPPEPESENKNDTAN